MKLDPYTNLEGFGVWAVGDDTMSDLSALAGVAREPPAGASVAIHDARTAARERGIRGTVDRDFPDLPGSGRRPSLCEGRADVEEMLVRRTGAARAVAAPVGLATVLQGGGGGLPACPEPLRVCA